jgi:tRNA A37 threonylcarbamoyladenosine modification protein TsaB
MDADGFTLYIERSSAVQSVALSRGGEIADAKTLDGADARSGDWVLRVRDFLAGRLVSRIVAGTGPGSFAGIRAALAFAQGYAIGSGCDVLGLPSPCALSQVSGPLAVVGDSRRGYVWIALFEGRTLATPVFQTEAPAAKSRVPSGVRVVSPDDARIGGILRESFGELYAGGALPSAEGLARAALANPALLVREPRPLYLNPAVRPNAPLTRGGQI